ncbi:MAG: glycosyltransferase family 39 protein, partial [Deltaproteobacteria bacterium]|nr:glycosyltransferase family 39 protein [Deltaproteobacteria bacterium]
MSHPRPHIAVVLAIACALFVMSAGVRLYRVSAGAIQVDEIHWKDRAHRIIGKIREGNWTQATHEPGHPGVPPALLMAAGQVIAQGVDERRGRSYGDPGYIDMYTSSRAATAAFASLLAPATFLALASVFGVTLAAIIGALLAFDPGHVGYSRLAHLDAVMTVFTVLSTILFYRAVEERRVGLKILSGICWGLALATKPTVLCLIPAFISYKVVRILTVDAAHDRGERRLVSISDIWAVIAGHIVLVVLYTRMWSHNSPYRTRLRVRSSLADGLYDFGMMLQAHPLLWGLATLLIIVLVAQTLVR